MVIIPNPLTIPPNDLIYSKRKEVLFVGRLEYQKRPDLLLDIWKKVAGFSPEWSLRILGDGMERKLLEKRIQREKFLMFILKVLNLRSLIIKQLQSFV